MNPTPTENTFTLTETTVGDIDGIRVGLSNIWKDEFSDNHDREQHELRGTLAFMFDNEEDDFDRRVAVGDRFSLQNDTFLVTSIHEGGELGSMTLERMVEENAGTTTPQGKDIPWLDLSILILLIGLPYIAADQAARPWTALGCLVGWFILVRPTWFGLIGFYGTALLLLNLLGLTVWAVFW